MVDCIRADFSRLHLRGVGLMPTWYALTWTGAKGRAWWHTNSFSCVRDAKIFARERAPEWATAFSIRNASRGSKFVLEEKVK
jgi:hypothetical protein